MYPNPEPKNCLNERNVKYLSHIVSYIKERLLEILYQKSPNWFSSSVYFTFSLIAETEKATIPTIPAGIAIRLNLSFVALKKYEPKMNTEIIITNWVLELPIKPQNRGNSIYNIASVLVNDNGYKRKAFNKQRNIDEGYMILK